MGQNAWEVSREWRQSWDFDEETQKEPIYKTHWTDNASKIEMCV